MNAINWSVTREDAAIIAKIAKRAVRLAQANEIAYDFVEAEMDLTAAHLNGCPLELADLLDAPDADFGHDVFGIRRFIDRTTGKVGGCFSPRYSRPLASQPTEQERNR